MLFSIPQLDTYLVYLDAFKQSEEKSSPEVTADVPQPNLTTQLGLDDWKITAPIGIAIAIPALSNGVRISISFHRLSTQTPTDLCDE